MTWHHKCTVQQINQSNWAFINFWIDWLRVSTKLGDPIIYSYLIIALIRPAFMQFVDTDLIGFTLWQMAPQVYCTTN